MQESHSILAGSLRARQVVALVAGRRLLLALALALEVVPLVLRLLAALTYILHQRASGVPLFFYCGCK